MQILDIYQMTGSPQDEIALLKEIQLRLVAGANELLNENADLRRAIRLAIAYIEEGFDLSALAILRAANTEELAC
jgi:hypothetical protein